jgi:hypothetical protein
MTEKIRVKWRIFPVPFSTNNFMSTKNTVFPVQNSCGLFCGKVENPHFAG